MAILGGFGVHLELGKGRVADLGSHLVAKRTNMTSEQWMCSENVDIDIGFHHVG